LKRTVSNFIIVLLFLGLFAYVYTASPVKAQTGEIVINPDGSMTPLTANITTSDSITYALTDNCYLPIVVNRSNIIIDGKGCTVQPSEDYTGFSLTGVNNVTIRNTTIKNCLYGISLSSSSDNFLSDNNITGNHCDVDLYSSDGNIMSGNNVTTSFGYGIALTNSSGNLLSGNSVIANGVDHGPGIGLYLSSRNTLFGNTVTENYQDGISLISSSDNNTLSDNNVTANANGIILDSSSGNILSGNKMAGNKYDFGTTGMNYIDASNLVEGEPVYYLINQSNILISPQTYPNGVGYLGLLNCDNVTVTGLTLTRNLQGLLLESTNDSRITDNNVKANYYGIDLVSSFDNVLSWNDITTNGVPSLFSDLDDFGFGIGLDSSSNNNTVVGNNVATNTLGISLESSGNILYDNNFTANGIGVRILYSSFNKIFHNDFINNTQPTSLWHSTNTWDNGYPSGGNFWSDYNGTDLNSGPYQNMTGSDGIGDTPCIIDSNNIDRYPLMAPYHTSTVARNSTSYVLGIVSNSKTTTLNFNATASAFSFNVTGTNGATGICRITIPLPLTESANLGKWTVTINGTQSSYPSVTTDANYTYIYFTYHPGTQTVTITSDSAVPEFQPAMLLPLITLLMLLASIVIKKRAMKTKRGWI